MDAMDMEESTELGTNIHNVYLVWKGNEYSLNEQGILHVDTSMEKDLDEVAKEWVCENHDIYVWNVTSISKNLVVKEEALIVSDDRTKLFMLLKIFKDGKDIV